jgi:hypothetical protein
MTLLRNYSYLIFLFLLLLPLVGQENLSTPQRTPEQEAGRQTERLQKELQLNAEQSKLINEINLRYARLRQTSNTRSEAMERMKNKDAEMRKVLSPTQYSTLQNMRMERSRVNANPSQTTVTPSATYDPTERKGRLSSPSTYPSGTSTESNNSRYPKEGNQGVSPNTKPRSSNVTPQRPQSATPSSGSGGRSTAPNSSAPSNQNRR